MELDIDLIRDTVGNLEMRTVKLVEERQLAEAEGRGEDAERLSEEIDALHTQLAQVTEIIAAESVTDEGRRYPAEALSPEGDVHD